MKWNEYTWYSKWASLIFFIVVFPILTFYIGAQYQEVKDLQNISNPLNNSPLLSIKNSDSDQMNWTTSTTTTKDVKTYSNSKYGFQFNYPTNFVALEYPRNGQQECVDDDPTINTDPKIATVLSLGGLNVQVVCVALTPQIGSDYLDYPAGQDEIITKINVNDSESYRHDYVTGTGYGWVVIQIPLDSSHYVEISESNGNSDRIRGQFPISEADWNVIISSFKIVK